MAQYSLYNHQFVEEKIYNYWIKKGYFYSVPNEKPSYTIVIPPPNVTGGLHIGHLLNNTIQDVLVRWSRMKGYNVCWMPGTDHASIATETKVISQLYKENKTKYKLGRDYFLERSWEWAYKQEYIILNQLQKLGCSCDWKRTSFTLDQERERSVTHCFVELYRRGLIYRDYRMVNWDANAKTTISNEEVIYQEQKGSLYYIQYTILGIVEGSIVVTTTRPETILGDTGICIHPTDNRYTLLIGKQVIIPIADRIVPIIDDEYVDKSFGAGALKITPSHDENDAILASIHSLDFIDIFNEDGTINKNGVHYIRKDRFKVRKEIVEELHKKGLLVKIETYSHRVAISERTHSIIETRRSVQWFLKIKDLAKPAISAVMIGDIRFHPKPFKNLYLHWMKNIQDWNISRQLWWGHRIPVYFYGTHLKEYVVAETKKEAIELVRNKTVSVENLIQDEDVLDTWFSSWIWPISVFNGIRIPKNPNIQYYYPTKDLITGPDILFFWVARMIMAGYAFLKKKPFDNVYFTGIVRDSKGRKMSKSLGNSPDPIKLIKKYGSDGVRMGLLLSPQSGNDLSFNEELCLHGRNFTNKLWNAFRFIHLLKIDNTIETPYYSHLAIDWFEHLLSKKRNYIEQNLKSYSIFRALNNIYNLIWHDFCSWFLEIIKPITDTVISQFVLSKTLLFFEDILKLLHPYSPYITEKIWHIIRNRSDTESLIICHWPLLRDICYKQIIEDFKSAEKLLISIRNVRKNHGFSLKSYSYLFFDKQKKRFYAVALKLANISHIHFLSEKPIFSQLSFLIESQEYFIFFLLQKKKKILKKEKSNKNILNTIMYFYQ
ncbi:valyl-tRNA synthetase [Candidatus Uzinura diaspidicola str. ASNER]|uniref:Valine--tRNA ligase n=1 Tax=Candidatus Uzinura diaspidicola str. ASNER TaxID=1133592 RepID=L7VJT1_9FLAO|nr:valyl-tRNA synthetase [Candidatus Uzinura diaspidicola str. ASNER]